ncbi:MAG TPA: sialidase family protein [Vicinamibacterales bacterium]
MTRTALGALLVTAAAVSVTCGRTINPADWTVSVQPAASPAAAASLAPQLTSSSRGVLASWTEQAGRTATLKFAEWTGDGWSPARTVASGDDWFVNWADVPSVIRLEDGTLAANWLQVTDARIEAYNLRLTYSRDDGRTWAPSFMPHHDGTKTQHGFASLFQMPGAGLGVIWLDGRDIELSKDLPTFEGGEMAVRFAAYDAAWKQTADAPVDARACECCPTTAVVTSDGVLAAFRDRDAKDIRDIHVSRFENGAWTPSAPVHKDDWEIFACPVNGPMLSASGREVAVAWFSVTNDQGHSYAAFSSDAGRTWGAPIRLDDQMSRGRVDVEMLEDGSAVALWIEFADKRSQIRMRRIDSSGGRSPAITVAGLGDDRASGYPRVARHQDELVFAWTESTGEGMQTVKTAIAQLP